MSSVSWNAGASLSSLCLPAGLEEKKAHVLNHISSYKCLVDVRPASRLEVRPRPEMLATGIAEVDALCGGLPRGCLSEICGPASSGKTSVLLAAMAAATRRDETCVLIDASDSFDPESGAAAGVEFGRVLWVRCGRSRLWNSGSSGMKDFKDSNHKGHPSTSLRAGSVTQRIYSNRFERRLEQVLKTTDLVLQSGGFGLVALDLAGIPEKYVRRIPLASWFRFQRAVEHAKTALLVVSEVACAQTCASLVMKLSAISCQPSAKISHAQLLEQMQIEAERVRTRLERKPAGSVRANFVTRAVSTG